jgi:hypothetical protein
MTGASSVRTSEDYVDTYVKPVRPGVDVMITIFCDFCQFSAKKLAFFLKTNVMITISAKTNRSLIKKRKNFR